MVIRGYSSLIFSQNPTLQSLTTASCQSSGRFFHEFIISSGYYCLGFIRNFAFNSLIELPVSNGNFGQFRHYNAGISDGGKNCIKRWVKAIRESRFILRPSRGSRYLRIGPPVDTEGKGGIGSIKLYQRKAQVLLPRTSPLNTRRAFVCAIPKQTCRGSRCSSLG
jgi:hypothetical protein